MDVKTPAEQLLFTTVRIEAFNGNNCIALGTGFVFEYPLSNRAVKAIVTNKHVVAGATSAVFTFTEDCNNQPALGKAHSLAFPKLDKVCFGHPDPAIDVAVIPLVPLENHAQRIMGVELFYRSISPALMPTKEQIDSLDAIEEVIFVGYPHGIWDTKNFLPVVRRGITASPVMIDFDGQPKFLIDASVFPGSSGSPVFLYNTGAFHNNKVDQRTVTFGTRFMFLGIVAAGHFSQSINQVQFVSQTPQKTPVTITKEMLDLGVVYKASTIVETVEALLKHNSSSVLPSSA